jgi:hypothetical protein
MPVAGFGFPDTAPWLPIIPIAIAMGEVGRLDAVLAEAFVAFVPWCGGVVMLCIAWRLIRAGMRDGLGNTTASFPT